MLVESALYSLPKSSDGGDDAWMDEEMVHWRRNWGWGAAGEQGVELSSARTLTSPSPRSAEAP
ncbi:hypothetical protein OCU04_012771 [Sclerotinia nivalis]|uniref:Uncharacterized protein n=1 Tax=Sclerotinia nivalis TaxID=352851 RepID=A0A9X0DDB3_9HELO|nr:hypothetical protein OCU04_012771 [Sclerotinia nivalis]